MTSQLTGPPVPRESEPPEISLLLVAGRHSWCSLTFEVMRIASPR
jgi:hypothetical protein